MNEAVREERSKRMGDLSELRETEVVFFCLKLHVLHALHLSSVIDEVSA